MKFLYEYVTTRGPDAFKQLVDVLTVTNNGHIAVFLNDGKTSGSKVLQNGNSSSELAIDDEFPLDPNEVWKVRPGIDRYDLNREEVYKMGSKPKGLVLIVNVRTFVNNTKEKRYGSEHDIKRLKEIFEQIGYTVVVEEENLKAADILKAVKRFAQREEHWACDSCIVVIMSHGTYHHATTHTINFYGWDTATVNSEDIISQFHGNKCKALIGKPKIFFFQACRGEQLNYTVPRVSQSEHEDSLVKKLQFNDKENEELVFKFSGSKITDLPEIQKKHETETAVEKNCNKTRPLSESCTDNQLMIENDELMNGNGCGNQLVTDSGLVAAMQENPYTNGDRVRSDADIFIGYSTTPGNVSRRDPDTGSWFIQILCQMIAKHAWNKDISTILDHADNGIGKKSDCGTKQSIEVVKTLTKKFYIQPGIYDA